MVNINNFVLIIPALLASSFADSVFFLHKILKPNFPFSQAFFSLKICFLHLGGSDSFGGWDSCNTQATGLFGLQNKKIPFKQFKLQIWDTCLRSAQKFSTFPLSCCWCQLLTSLNVNLFKVSSWSAHFMINIFHQVCPHTLSAETVSN